MESTENKIPFSALPTVLGIRKTSESHIPTVAANSGFFFSFKSNTRPSFTLYTQLRMTQILAVMPFFVAALVRAKMQIRADSTVARCASLSTQSLCS